MLLLLLLGELRREDRYPYTFLLDSLVYPRRETE